MRGPGVSFVGQQVDARRGPDGFVFVGLDVTRPGGVQDVIDVIRVRDRDETPSRATKSRDVVPTCPGEEAAVGVETDGDRLTRRGPGVQSRRWCRHESSV